MGGGSSQTTTQQQTAVNTSTTNAQKTYNFTVSQQGLPPDQAAALAKEVNTAQSQGFVAGAVSGASGSAGSGGLITLIVVLVVVALIFRR